jgi:cardiolipin synthase
MIYNLPNILTLSRIGVIPPLIALVYWDSPLAGWVACGLFTLAGFTDFFDGYFARSRRQLSRVGRVLDPIADKLLVASVIIMLVAVDRAPVIAALIILCRELMVSGLREYLAEISVGMPVSRLAKWKTVIQMVAIGFLLVGEAGPTFGAPFLTTVMVGETLLWIAAALTVLSGFDYLRAGLMHMNRPLPRARSRRRRARATIRAARSTSPAA